jgi:hypothetical protein
MTLWASACCTSNTCFFDPTGEIEPRRAAEAREVVRAGRAPGRRGSEKLPGGAKRRKSSSEFGDVEAAGTPQAPEPLRVEAEPRPEDQRDRKPTASPRPPPFPELVGRPNLTVRNPRRCRSLGAGSGLCRRSPVSASAAGTKSTGSAGGPHRLIGSIYSSVQFRLFSLLPRSDSFVSFCRYGKYKPIVEPAKW